jgi:tetratricopeptide (TPR) repeat protein
MTDEGETGRSPEEVDQERADKVYDLYRRGSELLDSGDFNAAAIPLEQARALEPDKSSIREALGRAYFRTARYAKARDEFAAVVAQYPTNDYAHFCLGRALELTGDRRQARHHLTMAAGLQPHRADYRKYRDRLRGKAA